jgi:hypothetical protein
MGMYIAGRQAVKATSKRREKTERVQNPSTSTSTSTSTSRGSAWWPIFIELEGRVVGMVGVVVDAMIM